MAPRRRSLFALDSDPHEPDGVTSSSTQAAWLRDRLAASSACWKLVYFHHAAYSSALHGPSAWMQWPFREWGADAVLGGHDHTYERLLIDGLPYFVNGLGGNGAYAFGALQAGSVARYNARHGAMRVTASASAITFEFINVDGAVVDTYSTSGGCSVPPTPTTVPTPTACSPRPPVRLTSTPDGTGGLRVTVAVTGQAGPLTAVRFGDARNAQILAPGGPPDATGNFNVPMVSTPSSYTFTVRRTTAGQAVHVPFVVVDACGDWTTFVGGGPSAF